MASSPSFLKNPWNIYISVLLLGCTSGCRFGNYMASPTTNSGNSDPINGYYETEPSTLTFCSNGAELDCKTAPLTDIPVFVKAVMTNPVKVKIDSYETGAGTLLSSEGSGYQLQTAFSSLTQISFQGSTPDETLWDNPACKSSLTLTETGTLSDQASSSHSSSGLKLKGRLALTLTLIQNFSGDCAESLTQMRACYNDAAHCGGSDEQNQSFQSSVREFFDPYLQAEVLTLDSIPTLTALAYEVTYE